MYFGYISSEVRLIRADKTTCLYFHPSNTTHGSDSDELAGSPLCMITKWKLFVLPFLADKLRKRIQFQLFFWSLKRFFPLHGWTRNSSMFSASNGEKIALFVDPFGNSPLWAIQVYGVQHFPRHSPWEAQCSSGSSHPRWCWLVEDRWSVLCWFQQFNSGAFFFLFFVFSLSLIKLESDVSENCNLIDFLFYCIVTLRRGLVCKMSWTPWCMLFWLTRTENLSMLRWYVNFFLLTPLSVALSSFLYWIEVVLLVPKGGIKVGRFGSM